MKATQTKVPPADVRTVDGARGKRGVNREHFEKPNQKPAHLARANEKQSRQQTEDRDRHPGEMGDSPRGPAKAKQI